MGEVLFQYGTGTGHVWPCCRKSNQASPQEDFESYKDSSCKYRKTSRKPTSTNPSSIFASSPSPSNSSSSHQPLTMLYLHLAAPCDLKPATILITSMKTS